MAWRADIRALADVDWSARPQVFVMFLLVIVSRLPFLNTGFGWDDDAWLVALRAYDLRHSEVYYPSRLPGFPLHEYSSALMIDGGWIATNGATLAFSLVAILAFALVLKEMNCRNKGLMVLCFAFLPVVWKNGAVTMDYMWTMSFLLLSWLFTLRKTYGLAGIMIGLAIGTRLSSAIMLLPFAGLLWTMRPDRADLAKYFVAALSVPTVLFAPLYLEYGFDFLTHAYIDISPLAIPVRTARVIGAIPLLLVATVAIYRWKVLAAGLKAMDRTNLFLGAVVILHAILFLWMPHEPEYWIPATPFALVLFGKIAGKKELTVLLVLFISAAFVNPDITLNPQGDMVLSLDGIVLGEWLDREEQFERADRIMDLDLPDHSVMILGRYVMVIAYLDEDFSCDPDRRVMWDAGLIYDFDKDIIAAYRLNLSQVQTYQSEGRTVYYLPEWEYHTMDTMGFSLSEEGCIALDV